MSLVPSWTVVRVPRCLQVEPQGQVAVLHLSVVEASLVFAVGTSQASDPLQASCQVLRSHCM